MQKRFSPKIRATKQNIQDVENNKPIGYALFKNKEQVYRGTAQRGRGPDRLEEHKRGTKIDFTQFATKPFSSIAAAKADEKRAIERDRPKHNRQHK